MADRAAQHLELGACYADRAPKVSVDRRLAAGLLHLLVNGAPDTPEELRGKGADNGTNRPAERGAGQHASARPARAANRAPQPAVATTEHAAKDAAGRPGCGTTSGVQRAGEAASTPVARARLIDADLDNAFKEIEERASELKTEISAEAAARERSINEVKHSLENTATGNYAPLAFGAFWLAVGVVLATLAPEIALAAAGRWGELWARI